MPQLLRKSLYLSSFIMFIAMLACSPTHGYKLKEHVLISEKRVQPVISADSSSLYKAKINLYAKYFTGLILLKQTDKNTSHLVFVTELGMKMFDFEITNGNFKPVYVFEPLNKPEVLNLLQSDLKLMLLQHLINKEADVYEHPSKGFTVYRCMGEKGNNYYLAAGSANSVNMTLAKGKMFVKEKVVYGYDASGKVNHIKLKHKGLIRLSIELIAIPKNI